MNTISHDLNICNIELNKQPDARVRKECRYCLSDDSSEKLIDPCKCEGTMKYVHQECLEDWIKNGNRRVYEVTDKNLMKVFLTKCEICKFQMRYTKNYKYDIFQSLIKLIKTIFGNLKNGLLLGLHSVIIYFLIKRLILFYKECAKNLKKNFFSFTPSALINFVHNVTVLISILVGINDIYMFYHRLLQEKRRCLITFLPKID
jgi:hypothetical protein